MPRVTKLALDDLDQHFIEAWLTLEDRALESNAFLSPNFILPAVRYLTPDAQPIVLAIHTDSHAPGPLMGVGVFEECTASAALPLPHLKAHDSIHTFMDGLLVDASCARPAITAFFEFLRSQDRWHGVHFSQCRADSPQSQLMEELAGYCDTPLCTVREWERAVIIPSGVTPNYMRELYSPSRRKSFRRAQNKLERMGIVALEVHRCGTQHDVHSETFLELEAMGWKGDERSALLSQAHEASFFRAMSRGFAASERAVFIELTLNGTPIFASSNYLSGTECFGFKSGWHPDYRAGSPGRQGELLTLASAPAEFHDIAVLDSCSEPGQYIDAVWPWRRRMSSRLFTATRVAHRASAVTTKLLRLKRRLTRNSTVRDS